MQTIEPVMNFLYSFALGYQFRLSNMFCHNMIKSVFIHGSWLITYPENVTHACSTYFLLDRFVLELVWYARHHQHNTKNSSASFMAIMSDVVCAGMWDHGPLKTVMHIRCQLKLFLDKVIHASIPSFPFSFPISRIMSGAHQVYFFRKWHGFP